MTRFLPHAHLPLKNWKGVTYQFSINISEKMANVTGRVFINICTVFLLLLSPNTVSPMPGCFFISYPFQKLIAIKISCVRSQELLGIYNNMSFFFNTGHNHILIIWYCSNLIKRLEHAIFCKVEAEYY